MRFREAILQGQQQPYPSVQEQLQACDVQLQEVGSLDRSGPSIDIDEAYCSNANVNRNSLRLRMRPFTLS